MEEQVILERMRPRAGCFVFLGIRGNRFASSVAAWATLAILMGACGINVSSKKLPISAPIGKAEFAEPAWMSVRKGTIEPNRYPGVKVNFARILLSEEPPSADPAGSPIKSLKIYQGDRIWLGVSPRGMVQDPPSTGWHQVGVVSSTHDHFQVLPIQGMTLPNQYQLEADKEYVLAIRITRGFEGDEGRKLLQILNVAPFSVDSRRVEASAVPLPAYGLTPEQPLGIRHRSSAFLFGASCRFFDADNTPRAVRPGDVAYVTLFGLRISEIMDLSGYPAETPGLYRFTLPVDTTELPETGTAISKANDVIIHCETSAGGEHSSAMASGIDYTPPDLSIFEGSGTLRSALLTAATELHFVGTCQLGTSVTLDVWGLLDSDLPSGNGPQKAVPVNGFQVQALPGYVNDCRTLQESSTPHKNTGLKLSLSVSRPASPGGYTVRVKAVDNAGNESFQFFPILVGLDLLSSDEAL